MPVFACKLPNGLDVRHQGKSIVLLGANIGEDLGAVSKNGLPSDNASRSHGYGLTTLSDDDANTLADWINQVTYKDGKKANGKLAEPFAPLENGSILGPFGSIEEARKETATLASSIVTGFEGLDAEKEAEKADGVKPDKEAGGNKK